MRQIFVSRDIVFTLLLLGHTDGLSSSTGGLGVLTADSDAPVVTETTMSTNLFHAFEIFTERVVHVVRDELRVGTILDVFLSVEHPVGDFVLAGVLHDVDQTFDFFRRDFTGTLVQVDIGLLAANVGVTTTDTFDGGQGVHDLVLSINVGVENTQDVLESFLVGYNERLWKALGELENMHGHLP